MSESTKDLLNSTDRFKLSNKELLAEWAIDVNQDPQSIPLELLDPSHPDLFEADTMMPYFERLRKEDPIHYHEETMFGPYWSITKYEDIMHVDSNHKVFSSDSRKGGINLGGIADPDPDPTFHLPMFIQEDPPKHDGQRKVITPMFTPNHIQNLQHLISVRFYHIRFFFFLTWVYFFLVCYCFYNVFLIINKCDVS